MVGFVVPAAWLCGCCYGYFCFCGSLVTSEVDAMADSSVVVPMAVVMVGLVLVMVGSVVVVMVGSVPAPVVSLSG